MEPKWTCDHRLLYISDKTGYWNLYFVEDLSNIESSRNVLQQDAEIGGPSWQFGRCSFSPHPTLKDIVVVLYSGVRISFKICFQNLHTLKLGFHFPLTFMDKALSVSWYSLLSFFQVRSKGKPLDSEALENKLKMM